MEHSQETQGGQSRLQASHAAGFTVQPSAMPEGDLDVNQSLPVLGIYPGQKGMLVPLSLHLCIKPNDFFKAQKAQ